ncbi:biofilm development regulator YmgB/AriR family protein [Pantoea sp. SO10]|uniref:biofilm development regulator YmgB/AriR family protein n=1 Tax=Pantoea sp. SO10 TaxID=2575375 RepID=UPI0010C9F8BC|nr:biofilm development regulator YmgB/AriR family protein [Pantoea sp. SO10]QCP61835.1 transcriptional regulator [Pantoea sp. SO10]
MQQSAQQTYREIDITDYLQNAGDNLSAEKTLIDSAIQTLESQGKSVSNSAIILYFISEIENTTDPMQLDALLNALKMVVGFTPGEEERWAFFYW